MKIFAIGDLHLSGEIPQKPMEIFGESWRNHTQKIKTAWRETVCAQDLVIVVGDISWAMNLNEVAADLVALTELPGKKVLLRGNHDYWWSSKSKMEHLYGERLFFLQNNFYACGDTAICGSRGWNLPNDDSWTESDQKILEREVMRLESSLRQATAAGFKQLILAMHFPPLLRNISSSPFSRLCEQYKVQHCLYGHLHGTAAWNIGFQGQLNLTEYRLVSADYLAFKPYEVSKSN